MQEIQSVWFKESLVHLQSAKVFHNLISLSQPPDKIYLLSGEKETEKTSFLCPRKVLEVLPYFKSHNLKVLSQDDEITN